MSQKQAVARRANYLSTNTRLILVAAFIFSLAILAATYGPLETATVSAQTSENRAATSPEAADVTFSSFVPITINDATTASPYPSTFRSAALIREP